MPSVLPTVHSLAAPGEPRLLPANTLTPSHQLASTSLSVGFVKSGSSDSLLAVVTLVVPVVPR